MRNKYFGCKMCDKKYNIGLCWLFHAIIKHHYEPVKIDLEAKVKTLLPGEVKHSIYTVYWDGKNIVSNAKK